MERKYVKRLVGKYCKIVTKEPGETRASAITGKIEDFDSDDGFVFINSDQGLGCLKINTIVAIKPSRQHGHQKRKIRHDTQAAIGIGTLIVFIAMILVAAVAASVIIQTSENLQNRAHAVGKQTIREVSSGMKIVDLTGYTDEEKTKIEYLAITIQPRAGSYDLNLNETLIYLQHDNLTVLELNYQNDSDSVNSTVSPDGIFHTLNTGVLNSTNFGLIAIRDQDNSIVNNYGISTHDLAIVIINLTAAFSDTEGLEPREEFYGRLVPEVGSAGIFMVSAPNTFDHRVVEL
ncbi:MAG: flagellin [Candidatus Thermoplasmatota archaeon]|nr:flagellin [Candidatus Thermoplasmatota archaeon]MBS3801400.1 flagellin [Candidatus Thermoplasmatota archaeon]